MIADMLLRGVWLLRYVVYRLLRLLPMLLAMALVTFLVMHATPGRPRDPVAESPLSVANRIQVGFHRPEDGARGMLPD